MSSFADKFGSLATIATILAPIVSIAVIFLTPSLQQLSPKRNLMAVRVFSYSFIIIVIAVIFWVAEPKQSELTTAFQSEMLEMNYLTGYAEFDCVKDGKVYVIFPDIPVDEAHKLPHLIWESDKGTRKVFTMGETNPVEVLANERYTFSTSVSDYGTAEIAGVTLLYVPNEPYDLHKNDFLLERVVPTTERPKTYIETFGRDTPINYEYDLRNEGDMVLKVHSALNIGEKATVKVYVSSTSIPRVSNWLREIKSTLPWLPNMSFIRTAYEFGEHNEEVHFDIAKDYKFLRIRIEGDAANSGIIWFSLEKPDENTTPEVESNANA